MDEREGENPAMDRRIDEELDENVDFELNLAADEGNDAYDALIRDIRERLAVGERIEGVPVLGPQVPAGGELRFFDVNLSYTDRGTTFTSGRDSAPTTSTWSAIAQETPTPGRSWMDTRTITA